MLLKVRDTAERLNVTGSCVYQLVEAGKLPCRRIGAGRGATLTPRLTRIRQSYRHGTHADIQQSPTEIGEQLCQALP